MKRAFLVASLVACRSASAPVANVSTPAPSPAVPVGAALRGVLTSTEALPPALVARYAALVDGRLRVDRVANGRVVEERLVRLPEPIVHWAWRDANEIVLVGERVHVYRVDTNQLAELPRPPRPLFDLPGSADLDRLDRDEGLVVTAQGEVWLHHCVWGYLGDEDPCVVDTHVRLVPGPAQRASDPPVPRRDAALPAPTNITLSLAGETLRCARDGVTTTIAAPPDSTGFSLSSARWVSHRPPIAIVHTLHPGADDEVAVPRLLAGCALAKLDGLIVASGPHALWAVNDGDGAIAIAWHGRAIAQLVGATEVRFAP